MWAPDGQIPSGSWERAGELFKAASSSGCRPAAGHWHSKYNYIMLLKYMSKTYHIRSFFLARTAHSQVLHVKRPPTRSEVLAARHALGLPAGCRLDGKFGMEQFSGNLSAGQKAQFLDPQLGFPRSKPASWPDH